MEKGISKRFSKIRESTPLNKQQFADSLEIPSTTVSDIELGKREPSKDVLMKLTSKYDVNLHWMLTGQGTMLLSSPSQEVVKAQEGHKVPVLNQRVSCGAGVGWEDEQNIKDYVDIFSLIPRRNFGRLFALSVQGNSMIGAGIKHGDYVLFCTEADQYLKDDIYVFSLDGDVYCKQLEFDKISKRIKIFSLRVADMEKAELLTTLNIDDPNFTERFHIYGRVFSWVRPNFE